MTFVCLARHKTNGKENVAEFRGKRREIKSLNNINLENGSGAKRTFGFI